MTRQGTTQLPGPGEVFFDHLAHFAPDLAGAAAALERAGFRLTPYAAQVNPSPEGGPPAPTGTANRCAMLRRGYVEILTAVSDTPLGRQLRDWAARYVGVHLLAFSSADAAAERERLAAAGFAPVPLVRMSRPAAGGGEARFTLARVPPAAMPEGRMQFLTHHTEEAVWRAADMAHPNGALSLEEAVFVVEDPKAVAERYARFLGRNMEPSPACGPFDKSSGGQGEGGGELLPEKRNSASDIPHPIPLPQAGEGVSIALDRGRLRFLDRTAFAAALPFVAIPSLPYIAAYRVGVADLGATRRFLGKSGLAVHATADGALAVPLPQAVGGAIIFAPGEEALP